MPLPGRIFAAKSHQIVWLFVILGRMREEADIYLVQPDKSHRQIILDYKSEFEANKEILHGSGGLDHIEIFDEWLQKIHDEQHLETVSEGRVPATEFLAIRTSDNTLVGMIQVRHTLNDFLLNHGGHIGYSVRKSQRRQGYATQMLKEVLTFCRNELDLDKVLLTCDKDNPGSAKVILANDGILENELATSEGTITQRYWISLS